MDPVTQTPRITMSNTHLNDYVCDEVSVERDLYSLILTERKRVVETKGRRFQNLDELVDASPHLCHIPQSTDVLKNFARIVVFLLFGEQYKVVNVQEFKERYQELTQGSGYVDMESRDVTSIQEPVVENKSLVFYCVDEYLSTPYKASLPFPVKKGDRLRLELLPLADD